MLFWGEKGSKESEVWKGEGEGKGVAKGVNGREVLCFSAHKRNKKEKTNMADDKYFETPWR